MTLQHRPGSIRVPENITIRLTESYGYDSPENQAEHLKVALEDSNC